MQNLIRFQTVTDSNAVFAFKLEERVKNKENFIYGEELSSWKN